MTENQLQSKVLKWLRSKDAYVIKTQPGAGTPTGCPDIIFLKEGFWGCIEVKKSATAKFQPLQQLTIMKLQDWSYCRVVYPDNWDTIRAELQSMLD
jgi:Holliday junction resolvase